MQLCNYFSPQTIVNSWKLEHFFIQKCPEGNGDRWKSIHYCPRNNPMGDKAGFREQNVCFTDEDNVIWNSRVCQQNRGCKCSDVSGKATHRQNCIQTRNFTNAAASVQVTHTVAKVWKCWTMPGRMDKGLNVLNVVMQEAKGLGVWNTVLQSWSQMPSWLFFCQDAWQGFNICYV